MFCILCYVSCVLYSVLCILCSVSYVLYPMFCILCSVFCVLYSVFCILCTVSYVLYPVFCILYPSVNVVFNDPEFLMCITLDCSQGNPPPSIHPLYTASSSHCLYPLSYRIWVLVSAYIYPSV